MIQSATHIHLVGIKGVAMTSLAQMLINAGKTISGSDVPDSFVTEKILGSLSVTIQDSFLLDLPEKTDCVVYTAAHSGSDNPQVQKSKELKIPVLSHAEALAQLIENQKTIAVCGVGGKSTTSAMITWIFSQTQTPCSFSVGVGNIPNLEKTGQFNPNAKWAIIEADEYVTNPNQIAKGEKPIPRFSYFSPNIICCSTIAYDHPDVYLSFQQTKDTFVDFLQKVGTTGTIISTDSNQEILKDYSLPSSPLWVGTKNDSFIQILNTPLVENKKTITEIRVDGNQFKLELPIPGEYNVQNAILALAAAQSAGIPIEQSLEALKTFPSTMRRFENKPAFNGAALYDDYAHHPHEIEAVLKAFSNWEPTATKIVAFQPHTYSRTKELFSEFVTVLSKAVSKTDQLILLDIFASARETDTHTVSSDDLAQALQQKGTNVIRLKSYQELATYLKENLSSQSACITLGAGDIYKVYEKLKS